MKLKSKNQKRKYLKEISSDSEDVEIIKKIARKIEKKKQTKKEEQPQMKFKFV